jgi:D-arabinose 5-phosphate isomerase GutQ/beta-phosphoglucomutase-like phosphatase (HAD superfamily)
MEKLLSYNLFIFDFDGTILDTEKIHCECWNNALADFLNKPLDEDNNILLTFSDYQKIFHSLEKNNSKNYLKYYYKIENYDKIYELKQKYYKDYISNVENINNIKLMEGVENFLNFLIKNEKNFIIVTNTSIKFIEIFKKIFSILNKALNIYTKEDFINRKPNPECYLKICNKYKYYKKICFEDSLTGMHALHQVNDITPVFIDSEDYYYKDLILNNYKNILISKKYKFEYLNNQLLLKNEIDENLFTKQILINNIKELENNFLNMEYIINQVTILLKNLDSSNHIYLSGMGKSGYVCKKSASTWQSLSIKCSYIDLPNLPHGDFGIFRDGDIFILVSNSGNTEEIIYILKYLKNNLKKKVTTISIVANCGSEMEKLSDFTYILKNINEADNINMTPSTSSLIFMALLDGIAINMKENITKEEFKLCHPAGSLGKI